MSKDQSNTTQANRVSFISIAINTLLTVFKVIAGFLANSAAMISDGIHSASDILSTVAVIAGINMSAKESDKGHQYGHERIEAVVSMLLAIILFVTGLYVGYSAVVKIITGSYIDGELPGTLALIAAIVSIIIKEAMYQWTKIIAKRINSTALMADAWHHRSDALSSIGAFVGIFAARAGYPIGDPIASLVICAFIVKAAWDIFYDAVNRLIDRACDEETIQKMRDVIMNEEGVITIDDLKTRLFGSRVYVDAEIGADKNLSLYDAHAIAQRVHEKIEESFPNVKHIMVHVNPKNVE